MVKLTQDIIDRAADLYYTYNCGTISMSDSLDDIAAELNVSVDDLQNSMAMWEYIDELMFECASCGWWCDTSEANESKEFDDGAICTHCYEEENYEK